MPTVLDTLLVSVRSAADYNHDDAVAPAVVLGPTRNAIRASVAPPSAPVPNS